MRAGSPIGPRDFTAAQLKLIRRSIARLCTSAEFDEFMAVAAQCGLDPLRRQISPLIIAADDAERRRLIPWTTIDGLRVIAARQGDYRPMETPPLIEYDEARKNGDSNPLGIARAEVSAWRLSEGAWHPVAGEAWWEEFAPIRQAAGGLGGLESIVSLDPAWRRMGRLMIAKCAEAQALRRGWPNVLSGLYGEEELHGLKLAEQTASELLRQREADLRQRRLDTRTLWFLLSPEASFEPLRVEQVLPRLSAFYEQATDAAAIEFFNRTNSVSLQTYWDWRPAEALTLRQTAERRIDALRESLQIVPAGSEDPSIDRQAPQGSSALSETLPSP